MDLIDESVKELQRNIQSGESLSFFPCMNISIGAVLVAKRRELQVINNCRDIKLPLGAVKKILTYIIRMKVKLRDVVKKKGGRRGEVPPGDTSSLTYCPIMTLDF